MGTVRLATAVSQTWKCVLITSVLLGLGGTALPHIAPGARSIGQAIHQRGHQVR